MAIRRHRTALMRRLLPFAIAGVLLASAPRAGAQTSAEFFKANCASCHTIGGGRLTGPDLKGVTDRRDRAWLTRYLPDPKRMIDSGDPIASQLFQEARGVLMPAFPQMTAGRVQELIDFLASESKLARSVFVGSQISDRPFTPQDRAAGLALFQGVQALKGGGPACVSCHEVGNLPSLGGGRLGPDLTLAIERLQGRKGLTAWLSAPATSTMQSVFGQAALQEDEILSLTAYLDDAARTTQPSDTVSQLNFLMLGLAASGVGLVVADLTWKRRFRAVRRPLVEDSSAPGGRR